MPKKRFFSDPEPENDAFESAFGTDDAQFRFDGSFGEMQPMNLFGDEAAAADDFAALLQPASAQETAPAQAPMQQEQDADFGNLFGTQPQQEASTDFDSFFSAQSGNEADAFFAPATETTSANESGFDMFASPQDAFFPSEQQALPTEIPLSQAPQTYAQEDVFAEQNMPTAAPFYDKPSPGFETDAFSAQPPEMPFDIAEPMGAVQPELSYMQPEEPEQEYAPKRKYKPVFSAPVPSALDELRAGIVRPASPITDIAAMQVPVVITAADAASAEAAAREAAAQATAQATAAGEAASATIARQDAYDETMRYGYEAPQTEAAPTEFGFDGHANPTTYTQEPAEYGYGVQPQEPFADFGFAPEQTDAVQQPADYSYVAQPQESFADFGFAPEAETPPQQFTEHSQDAQDNFTADSAQTGFFVTEQPTDSVSPQAFADNLHALLGEEENIVPLEAPDDNLFGAQQEGFDALGNLGDFGVAQDDMQYTDSDQNTSGAPAFNPFESEEWTGLADDDDQELDAYDDDGGKPPRGRRPKKGGALPLIITLIVLLVLIGAVVLYVLFGGKKAPASSIVSSSAPVVSIPESIPEPVPVVDPIPRDEWYMKLVNKSSVLANDYTPKLSKIADGIEVDERIVEPMNQMVKAAKAAGMNLKIVAGYRSYARQESSYKSQVAKLVKAGKAQAEAEKLAADITAPPGTSEHNLGLSADIQSTKSYDYSDTFKDSAEAKWLAENAATYGFILRYPEGKQDKTGFAFEPWHYRYVGVDQAARIKASGLTLEEYLAQDAPTGIPGQASAESVAQSSMANSAGTSSSAASSAA